MLTFGSKTENHKCQLTVAEKSVLKFYKRILYDKANAFTLNLTFPQFFYDSRKCVTARSRHYPTMSIGMDLPTNFDIF